MDALIYFNDMAEILGMKDNIMRRITNNIGHGFPKPKQKGSGRQQTLFNTQEILDWKDATPNYKALLADARKTVLKRERLNYEAQKGIVRVRRYEIIYDDPASQFNRRAVQFLTQPMVNPFPIKKDPNAQPIKRQRIQIEERNDSEQPSQRCAYSTRGSSSYVMHMPE